MIILALDTTAITASVALLDSENVIGSFSIHNKLTHSEKLLPMIDALLENSGYNVDDIELIAVSRGPGSFTGVRIGIATAKGLAFAKNIPIVGVSALEALAYTFLPSSVTQGEEILILPSMDARRNELYNAAFLLEDSRLERLLDDRAISCEEIADELKHESRKIYINGDGAKKLYDYLTENTGHSPVLAPENLMYQNAVPVGKIGYKNFLEGKMMDAITISPLYLRTSQAERVKQGEVK